MIKWIKIFLWSFLVVITIIRFCYKPEEVDDPVQSYRGMAYDLELNSRSMEDNDGPYGSYPVYYGSSISTISMNTPTTLQFKRWRDDD